MGSHKSKAAKDQDSKVTHPKQAMESEEATRVKDEATQQKDSCKQQAAQLKQEVDQLKKKQKSTEETVVQILEMTAEMCTKKPQQGFQRETVQEVRDSNRRNNLQQNTCETQAKPMVFQKNLQMNIRETSGITNLCKNTTQANSEKQYYQKKFLNDSSPVTSMNFQGPPRGQPYRRGGYTRGRSKSCGRVPHGNAEAQGNTQFERRVDPKTCAKVQYSRKRYQFPEKPLRTALPETNTTFRNITTEMMATNNKSQVFPAVGSQMNLGAKQQFVKSRSANKMQYINQLSSPTSVPPIYLQSTTSLPQVCKLLEHFEEKSVIMKYEKGILILQANDTDVYNMLMKAIDSQLPQARVTSTGGEIPKEVQVVLKGLPKSTDPKEIENELRTMGYDIKSIHQATYKSEQGIQRGGTYFITLPHTQKNATILHLKSLFRIQVIFEPMRK